MDEYRPLPKTVGAGLGECELVEIFVSEDAELSAGIYRSLTFETYRVDFCARVLGDFDVSETRFFFSFLGQAKIEAQHWVNRQACMQ